MQGVQSGQNQNGPAAVPERRSRPDKLISLATAHGFERYAFGPDIIFGSSSWKDAEQKIAEYLFRRAKYSTKAAASYYSAGSDLLWREYQVLFMCQFLEFELASFIGHLQRRGRMKPDFIATLQQNRRADPVRARDAARLSSPASLLVDFAYTLGHLVDILDRYAARFAGRAKLISRLKSFNKRRIAFVHHSFSGQRKIRYRSSLAQAVVALKDGKEALRLMAEITSNLSGIRKGRGPSFGGKSWFESGRSRTFSGTQNQTQVSAETRYAK